MVVKQVDKNEAVVGVIWIFCIKECYNCFNDTVIL